MTDIPIPVLEVEMVPRTCFFSNLRSNLRSKDWQKLRMMSIANANGRCQICGSLNHGRSLECHEIWFYDEDNGVQRLTGLLALCRECHRAKHMALAREMGWEDAARRHLLRINRWTHTQLNFYLEEAFELFEHRSQMTWKLDITWLEGLDVEIPSILDRDR
jgi:5-methylcytosine-specific restriction endonuclease McrA